MKSEKNLGRLLTAILIAVMMIASVLVVMPSVLGQDYTLILDLTIGDTARVVDYDNGIYVVGTSIGDLYVINEVGDYTVTDLLAGGINDVRIENGFIAVAAGNTVIELELDGLTPEELWRTTDEEWYKVVSTDLSEDGNYVCYLAQREGTYYENAGEIGVLQGGGAGGGLNSKQYTSGYRPTNWWLDATGDMEYIAASHPTYPPTYRVGVGLYHFDGSTLTFQWWTFLVAQYDVTEVRISENKDYVAAATSSGVYMDLLRLTDGAILWSHETPGKEQYACDGDDNLNYVIGATQAWSSPYPWFILKNLGESGYEVITQGQMGGAINDIDSTPDCSYFAFGSDAGEVVLFERTGDTVETVFTVDGLNLVDAIEIGSKTLLVGGNQFIHLYAYLTINIYVDIKPGSCPNPIGRNSKGVLPVAICSTGDFDVTTIDPDTIQLTRAGVEGYVEPLRWSYEDVATPYEGEECGCHELNGDGYMDLSLKFENQEVVDVLELDLVAGETIPLIITGYLKEEYDGTPIEGQDCVWILLSDDVGVTEIISPTTGTAQTFTPEVTVVNFGTKKEKNVPTNMVIEEEGGIVEYDETVYIDIDAGETLNVIFPDWTPDDWQVASNEYIDYSISACTMMDGDEDPSNDCVSKDITLYFPILHDVGVTEIISPTSGTYQTFTPEVIMENFGQFDETDVPVNIVIPHGLLLHEDFSGIFPPDGWSTDYWTRSFSNNAGGEFPEAGCYKYTQYYEGDYYDNYIMTPPIDCSGVEKIELEFKFTADVQYNDYCDLYVKWRKNAGDPWEDITPWNNPIPADFGPETFIIEISGDPDLGDGFQIKWEYIGYYYYFYYWWLDDVEVREIVETTTDYDETVYIDIDAGETLNVIFPDWTPDNWQVLENVDIDYTVTACTMMDSDEDPSNDCVSEDITLYFPYFHDVGVTEIISPSSGISQTFTPEVTVENFGQFDETDVPVNMVITQIDYTTLLTEDFSGDIFPPDGWSTDYWTRSFSNNAGGEFPEAGCYKYTQYYEGDYYDNYIMTPPIDCSGVEKIELEFKFTADVQYNDYCDLYVKWRKNAGDPWEDITPWNNPIPADFGPETFIIEISGDPDLGDGFQIKWEYIGYYYFFNYWWLDDVEVREIVETTTDYDETVYIDIDAGEILNVIFPDWTPSDIGKYIVSAYTAMTEPPDENAANDCETDSITLY